MFDGEKSERTVAARESARRIELAQMRHAAVREARTRELYEPPARRQGQHRHDREDPNLRRKLLHRDDSFSEDEKRTDEERRPRRKRGALYEHFVYLHATYQQKQESRQTSLDHRADRTRVRALEAHQRRTDDRLDKLENALPPPPNAQQQQRRASQSPRPRQEQNRPSAADVRGSIISSRSHDHDNDDDDAAISMEF